MKQPYDDKQFPREKWFTKIVSGKVGEYSAVKYIRHDVIHAIESQNRMAFEALEACHKTISLLLTSPEDLCKLMCQNDGIDPLSQKFDSQGQPYEAWRDYILEMSETLTAALQINHTIPANDA